MFAALNNSVPQYTSSNVIFKHFHPSINVCGQDYDGDQSEGELEFGRVFNQTFPKFENIFVAFGDLNKTFTIVTSPVLV